MTERVRVAPGPLRRCPPLPLGLPGPAPGQQDQQGPKEINGRNDETGEDGLHRFDQRQVERRGDEAEGGRQQHGHGAADNHAPLRSPRGGLNSVSNAIQGHQTEAQRRER